MRTTYFFTIACAESGIISLISLWISHELFILLSPHLSLGKRLGRKAFIRLLPRVVSIVHAAISL